MFQSDFINDELNRETLPRKSNQKLKELWINEEEDVKDLTRKPALCSVRHRWKKSRKPALSSVPAPLEEDADAWSSELTEN